MWSLQTGFTVFSLPPFTLTTVCVSLCWTHYACKHSNITGRCVFIYGAYFFIWTVPFNISSHSIFCKRWFTFNMWLNVSIIFFKWCVGYTDRLNWQPTSKNEIYKRFACKTLMSSRISIGFFSFWYMGQRKSYSGMLSKYSSGCTPDL